VRSSFQSAAHDEAKDVFVSRLARLIRLRRDFGDDLNQLGIDLLDRSIYATYRDCIDFGAADEARQLVGDVRPEASRATWRAPRPTE
jgi:hypothetical protein